MNDVINWLLEYNNPAIKFRTQTEILGQTGDVSQAKKWIYSKLPEKWYETKGLWYVYYVTSLAECGLSKDDIPFEYLSKAFDELDINFQYGCGDFMLLRALIKLGFHEHKTIESITANLKENNLLDGGFLCTRRLKKFNYTPKSCYKANLHALMFLAECKKKNMDISFGNEIIDYFLKRNIFYRKDDKSVLIINGKEGWRIIDTFYPFEPMRVGIHTVVETFSALGFGNDERLKDAWDYLNKFKNYDGKMILAQTLTKSYLPKEKVGKPSKWVTFYTLLAEKEREK